MQIFIVGMIRSGSTLHFNMARELLKAAQVPFEFEYVSSFEDLSDRCAQPSKPGVVRLFKFHFYDTRLEALFQEPGSNAFFIYRNILDVAASLIRKTGHGLGENLGDLKGAIWTKHQFLNTQNVHVSKYEDMMSSNQLELLLMSQHLGLELPKKTLVEIADRLMIENQRALLETLDYDEISVPRENPWSMSNDSENGETGYVLVNKESQLHKNHITSDGRPGGWEGTLTAAEVSELCALEVEVAQKYHVYEKGLYDNSLYEEKKKLEQVVDWFNGKEVHPSALITELQRVRQAEQSLRQAEHDKAIEALQAEHDKAVETLHVEHGKVIKTHKIEIQKLRSALSQKEKSLAVAAQIRAKLEEAYEQWGNDRNATRKHAMSLYAWREVAQRKLGMKGVFANMPSPQIVEKLEPLVLPQLRDVHRPKISIITPSYNSGADIERAIKSVQSQNYDNWEHIIIDGGSTDQTLDILKRYDHLIWKSEKDRGQVDAMNKGFAMASGDIIAYLNADDYYKPGAFEHVTRLFDSDDVKIVYGDVHVYDAAGDSWWMNRPRYDFRSVLRHWESDAFCVNPVGYFYRREVQESVPILESDGAKHDLAFLIGVAQRYERQSKKTDACLGVFINAQDTQTAREQSVEDYWTPGNFAFLDRFLDGLSELELAAFRKAQEAGYAQRRAWVREAQERAKASTEN